VELGVAVIETLETMGEGARLLLPAMVAPMYSAPVLVIESCRAHAAIQHNRAMWRTTGSGVANHRDLT